MKRHKYTGNCELCNRFQPLSFHHLIPVTVHKNKWFKKNFDKMDMATRGFMLCSDCHEYIHQSYKAKELGRRLNTEDALKKDSKIAKFLKFVKKKK